MHVNVSDCQNRSLASGAAKSLVFKRALDIVGSLLGLVILWPLFVVISILVKVDSPGPAFFRQKRMGLNGKPFTFLKFRTMHNNSDQSVHRNYVADLVRGSVKNAGKSMGAEKIFKLAEDPRITRVGRVLRKTSLDEVPQLINVLKGEMSLVGPRPAIPYEVEMYKDGWKRRLTVIPGMTGLWQVSGRSERTFEEMMQLDLEYIDNWSFLRDIGILVRTVSVVLRREGAS